MTFIYWKESVGQIVINWNIKSAIYRAAIAIFFPKCIELLLDPGTPKAAVIEAPIFISPKRSIFDDRCLVGSILGAACARVGGESGNQRGGGIGQRNGIIQSFSAGDGSVRLL